MIQLTALKGKFFKLCRVSYNYTLTTVRCTSKHSFIISHIVLTLYRDGVETWFKTKRYAQSFVAQQTRVSSARHVHYFKELETNVQVHTVFSSAVKNWKKYSTSPRVFVTFSICLSNFLYQTIFKVSALNKHEWLFREYSCFRKWSRPEEFQEGRVNIDCKSCLVTRSRYWLWKRFYRW